MLDAAAGDERGSNPAGRALERAALVLADCKQALVALAEVEGRMAKALEDLGLAELVTSIPGLSVVSAAAILAETGDPTRFDDAKAVVKHAGLCPRDNASGVLAGRPPSRVEVGRCCVWLADQPPAQPAQRWPGRTAVAAALLRQLWVVWVNRIPWELAVASGTTGKEVTDPAA